MVKQPNFDDVQQFKLHTEKEIMSSLNDGFITPQQAVEATKAMQEGRPLAINVVTGALEMMDNEVSH
jgi:hypothetical protein